MIQPLNFYFFVNRTFEVLELPSCKEFMPAFMKSIAAPPMSFVPFPQSNS